MKRQKKSNNIFNKPILPESLFYQQVQKDYKVGGIKVQGCWLKDTPPPIYRSNVKSALQLADLKAQLETIKKNSAKSATDVFRMAELRKNMENFQLLVASPTKKKLQQEELEIRADDLILQKVDSFWGKVYERKCKIQGKQLFFQSEKEKKEKPIDIQNYTIQLEDKNKPKNESKQFPWPQNGNSTRLFLYGDNLRSYCIYGVQKTLKNIIKKIKIESIKLTQVDIFKNLSKQYQQKIMILFGNKLRIYQHMLKEKQKNDLNIAFDLIQKSNLLDDIEEEEQQQPQVNQRKRLQSGAALDESFQNSESSARNANSKSSALNKSVSLGPSSPYSPLLSPARSPLNTESQFRMRARRSTINYDDLDNEDDGKDYNVQDFTLQIKEVAHSDSEQQPDNHKNFPKSQQMLMYHLHNSMQLNKKKNPQHKKPTQQITIPQFMNQDSNSQSSSHINPKKPKKPTPKKPTSRIQFEIKQTEFTHYVHIAFFEDFCAYSQHDIDLIFYQRVLPEIEYENMSIPVCVCEEIKFKRDKQEKRLYIPEKQTIIKVSKHCQQIWVLLKNKTNQIKQKLQLNLSQILYAVDQSQLLYLKTDNRIVCAGKLKIIASPNPINPSEWKQETTLQFLHKYLITEVYTRQDKYKFVDYKKRNQQVCQKWNNKMMKRIINRADENQFMKAIYYGFPKNILENITNTMRSMRSLSRTETRMQSSSSYFGTQCYSLMQNQIMKMKAYDLRVFIKIDKLVDFIAQEKKNQHMQKRLEQICTFFTYKYGKSSIEKLISVFVVQTLRKVENMLLQLKNSRQMEAFLMEYFQVEYQIDDIMREVSAYFI